MNQPIEQFAEQANENMTLGENTRDDVLKEEILRQILYTEAGQLTIGEQVIGTTTLDGLSVSFEYPNEASAQYPVDHDAVAENQRISWSDFSMKLYQAQTRYQITDGAKLEGMSDMQMNRTEQRGAEALARRKDENILATLENGAVSENDETLPSGNEWDDDSVDMVDELWDMWTDILVNAPLTNMDVQNFAVILPVEIWAKLNQTELINNVQQRLRDYLGQTFGFEFWPTKMGMHEDHKYDLQDSVIMLIPDGETATHATLAPEYASERGVPLTERRRNFAQGEEWVVKQWFNTKVYEHESGSPDKSPRISVRKNVNSNSDARGS